MQRRYTSEPSTTRMPESMTEYLRQDMECEGLLECVHGLKKLDRDCYRVLVNAEEPLTVDDVADEVNRERSTTYRAVQRLMQSGLVQKEQINYEEGGYCHVYRPIDANEVAEEMRRTLNDWYAKMGQLIHEFEEKYEDETVAVADG